MNAEQLMNEILGSEPPHEDPRVTWLVEEHFTLITRGVKYKIPTMRSKSFVEQKRVVQYLRGCQGR